MVQQEQWLDHKVSSLASAPTGFEQAQLGALAQPFVDQLFAAVAVVDPVCDGIRRTMLQGAHGGGNLLDGSMVREHLDKRAARSLPRQFHGRNVSPVEPGEYFRPN